MGAWKTLEFFSFETSWSYQGEYTLFMWEMKFQRPRLNVFHPKKDRVLS